MEKKICNEVVTFRVVRGSLVNYCYLIVNPELKKCVVVDPAWNKDVIVDFLEKYDINLSGVLVTHHHFDHIHLSQYFAGNNDCNIYMSEIEYNFYKIDDKKTIVLNDCIPISLAGLNILPIVTPGHTAGSICYLVENALFTGDTLFNEGCGLCYGHGADPVMMYSSLQKLKYLISDDVKIYPGHRFHSDLGLTFEEVKKKNLYLQFNNEDKFVSFRMRNNQIHLVSFL